MCRSLSFTAAYCLPVDRCTADRRSGLRSVGTPVVSAAPNARAPASCAPPTCGGPTVRAVLCVPAGCDCALRSRSNQTVLPCRYRSTPHWRPRCSLWTGPVRRSVLLRGVHEGSARAQTLGRQLQARPEPWSTWVRYRPTFAAVPMLATGLNGCVVVQLACRVGASAGGWPAVEDEPDHNTEHPKHQVDEVVEHGLVLVRQ